MEVGPEVIENVRRKARGCMLGLMIGDALGAAVEGWPQEEIRRLAQMTWGADFIQDYILAVPMGTFVADRSTPASYLPAIHLSDTNFVGSGPPRNEAVERQCARKGMYTDDTNSCLAVAMSIEECRGVVAEHVARTCAELFLPDDAMSKDQASARVHAANEAFRGCPPTAKQVLLSTLAGMSPAVTGLPPNFPFEGGSFANGGAMRISPLAIAYRSADAKTLRHAVATAICASHRHPEAVDFAVVQAAAVQYALSVQPDEFDGPTLLAKLASLCENAAMQSVISKTMEALAVFPDGGDEFKTLQQIVEDPEFKRPSSGMGFQIASVHMAPCVLWTACRHHKDPRRALQAAIDLGGDTDTTASMVGAIVGALHGEEWCISPLDWAAGLENGVHGRDFALNLAEKLVKLDLPA